MMTRAPGWSCLSCLLPPSLHITTTTVITCTSRARAVTAVISPVSSDVAPVVFALALLLPRFVFCRRCRCPEPRCCRQSLITSPRSTPAPLLAPMSKPTPATPATTPAPKVTDPTPATAQRNAPVLRDPTALKDEREHAHERQRAKKAGDRAKGRKGALLGRADKAKTKAAHGHGMADSKDGKAGLLDVVGFWSDVWAGVGTKEKTAEPETPGKVFDFNGTWVRRDRSGAREVGLADLIRPAKAHRKARTGKRVCGYCCRITIDAMCGVDGDFEVVPHVRSVIVLEDSVGTPAMELDEPWEYISDTEEPEVQGAGRKVGAVSYAQVVSRAN
ncbi:hypothetical protein FA95DRAFT_99591 [Auriscalpium vulgare]|uniref:Uncharacterized protein n=1 Tax=Auriscalpium vulgare TaxID=40419 RepID=A0ACB8RNP4_9AGAM|nr:hypothetical protein FA95DRAFT_99591 [Auriscalpium vulgare]